jgi:hypothetical protein
MFLVGAGKDRRGSLRKGDVYVQFMAPAHAVCDLVYLWTSITISNPLFQDVGTKVSICLSAVSVPSN